MSRSKRPIRRERPDDGCWLCDSRARVLTYRHQKQSPDLELQRTIEELLTKKIKLRSMIKKK